MEALDVLWMLWVIVWTCIKILVAIAIGALVFILLPVWIGGMIIWWGLAMIEAGVTTGNVEEIALGTLVVFLGIGLIPSIYAFVSGS